MPSRRLQEDQPMPEAAVNSYKIDRRAIEFTLYEHLHVEQLFEHERYAHLSRTECDAIIDQCARFVTEVTGPLNASGDRSGCRLEGGTVHTPAGFKDAWKELFDLRLVSFAMKVDAGGFGGPTVLAVNYRGMTEGV